MAPRTPSGRSRSRAAVALSCAAANQRSIVAMSAALPRMICRHCGCAAIARSIVRAPSAAGVPSIFQNCGVSPRRYDSPMKSASIAGRPTASNVSSGSCRARHEDFHDQLSTGATAPCLEHVQLVPLAFADLVRVVRSIADQHLDERADERPLERLRRPCERKRAGLLGGSSDDQTVATCLVDDGRRVLCVQQQRAELAHARRAIAREPEAVGGEPLDLRNPRPRNRSRITPFFPLPPVVGSEHVDALGVQHQRPSR